MNKNAFIIKGSVWNKTGFLVQGRVLAPTGNPVVQADISSITCKVFDLNASSVTPVATPSITVSDVVFNSLQLDETWEEDTVGYNFKHAGSNSLLTEPKHVYRIEYIFTPVTGSPFAVVAEIETERLLSL